MHPQIIKALLEKPVFDEACLVIGKDTFSGNSIASDSYDCLKSYYSEHDNELSVEELRDYHKQLLCLGQKESRIAMVDDFYIQVEEADVDSIGGKLVDALRIRGGMDKYTNAFTRLTEMPDKEKIRQLGENLVQLAGEESVEDNTFELPSVEDFCKDMESISKWDVSCPAMDEMMQGFGPGRSWLVFGLSNVGKSSFCINEAVHFMKQGARILDVSVSEDPLSRRIPRILQCCYNINFSELQEGKAEYYERFLEEFGELYRFNYMSSGASVRELKPMIEQFEPDILIVDGYWKMILNKSKDKNDAQARGMLLAELKSYAEEYQFGVIPVQQAADSARGKTLLTMQDIAGSKVDVPGELEIATGISAGENRGVITINFAKNKLGPEDSVNRQLEDATCQWRDF
jgi:KaiC/GvpD/RAD55 family RecA-like ATPase